MPASLRKLIANEIHSSAHFGADKTFALLKDRLFWPNMYSYVRNFVS